MRTQDKVFDDDGGSDYCEDYPCCGHPAGQCKDRPEYHAEYWSDLRDRLGDERYELYLERLEAQEMGY